VRHAFYWKRKERADSNSLTLKLTTDYGVDQKIDPGQMFGPIDTFLILEQN